MEQLLSGNRESSSTGTHGAASSFCSSRSRENSSSGAAAFWEHIQHILLEAHTAEQLFQGAHTTDLLEHGEQGLCGADPAAPLELLSVLRGEQKEGAAPCVAV